MTTIIPVWLGATAGYEVNAGAVDQFLGTHQAIVTYSGSTLQSQQATGSSVYTSTASQYLAQQITTGSAQTAIGTVNLQISTVGGSAITPVITPLTVSLYASSLGAPTGSALVSVSVSEQYVYGAPFFMTIPLNVTGLSVSTAYWLVVSPGGSGGSYYVWQQSNQPSGALTSPDGSTWTSQAYGFMFQVYDNTGTAAPPLFIQEDGGARLVQLTYNASGLLTQLVETTTAQGSGSVYSSRTFTYSGTTLTGVS